MFEGDMAKLMEQAKNMQEKVKQAQEAVTKIEVTGESGAGMVKVRMTGKYDVKKVEFGSGVLNESREVVEDLVAAAINDAVRKLESAREEKMKAFVSDFGLPADMKMPF